MGSNNIEVVSRQLLLRKTAPWLGLGFGLGLRLVLVLGGNFPHGAVVLEPSEVYNLLKKEYKSKYSI